MAPPRSPGVDTGCQGLKPRLPIPAPNTSLLTLHTLAPKPVAMLQPPPGTLSLPLSTNASIAVCLIASFWIWCHPSSQLPGCLHGL